jgi:hypothetical protein
VGWIVHVLDNLEPSPLGSILPLSFAEEKCKIMTSLDLLWKTSHVVFHEAACGGTSARNGKYVLVNSFDTANQLGVNIELLARGVFRTGEIRSLISDISRIQTIGYEPRTTIEQGFARYVNWIKTQIALEDYFCQTRSGLHTKVIVQNVGR